MPLYDAVRAPRPRKRDRKLHILIAIGLILVLAAFIPILWAAHLQRQYRHFISGLGESVQYAKEQGGLYVRQDGRQFRARAADDFLRHPVFGIGLCSTRNADVFTGVEGSMVFYHNSLAQVMGSMGLVGIVAYGRLLHDRIALLRQGSRDPFVRILTLSYLGMFLISLCNPGEFCPFPNAALMVMVFAQAEEAVGDVAVPVRQLLARHLGAPAGFLQF